MEHTSTRPADDIEKIVHTYGNMLFRLCLITLGNTSDAQDVVQETLIKYLKKAPEFRDEEHKKAWLTKVANNHCRDDRKNGICRKNASKEGAATIESGV